MSYVELTFTLLRNETARRTPDSARRKMGLALVAPTNHRGFLPIEWDADGRQKPAALTTRRFTPRYTYGNQILL
jgi:hypothetical protein